MTWMKVMPELFAKMFADELSVEAGMAHLQGLAWLYQQERGDCVIPFKMIAKAGVLSMIEDEEAATVELLDAGYWEPHESGYVVVNHGDVLRESLVAQANKKARDKRNQQSARDRKSGPSSALTSARESAPPPSKQASNHTSKSLRERSEQEAGSHVGECKFCHRHGPLDDKWTCRAGCYAVDAA